MSLSYDEVYNLNNDLGPSAAYKASLGYKVGRARGLFTATSGKEIGAHTLDMFIPKGAIVTRMYYKVLTTFSSNAGNDAATISLGLLGAADVLAAVAISDGGTPWDAGAPVATLVTTLEASWLETTADTRLVATVAVEALEAGKLAVFAEYAYHGDTPAT